MSNFERHYKFFFGGVFRDPDFCLVGVHQPVQSVGCRSLRRYTAWLEKSNPALRRRFTAIYPNVTRLPPMVVAHLNHWCGPHFPNYFVCSFKTRNYMGPEHVHWPVTSQVCSQTHKRAARHHPEVCPNDVLESIPDIVSPTSSLMTQLVHWVVMASDVNEKNPSWIWKHVSTIMISMWKF